MVLSMFKCPWGICKWYAYLFNRSTCAISFRSINSMCAAEQHCGSYAFCNPSQAFALRIYYSTEVYATCGCVNAMKTYV